MSDNTNARDSWARLRETLGKTFKTVQDSPLGQGAKRYIDGEWERILGSSPSHRNLDARGAERLAMHLHKVLGHLITTCEDQRKQLDPGGIGPLLRKEPPAPTIDMAISGLVTITMHFRDEIADHVKLARDAGSKIAQRIHLEDPAENLPPPMAVSVGMLSNDQMHNIAENLRRIHQDTANTAKQILLYVTGANGTNPYTQDTALNEAVRLLGRLVGECLNVLDMLDTGYHQHLLRSGNSGKLGAIGGQRQSGRPAGSASSARSAEGVEIIAHPPKESIDPD
jgi:hypothetical protein